MRLEGQNAVKGVGETFLGDSSVQIALLHSLEVFVHFVEEQEHIHAGCNGGRHQIFPFHPAGKANHVGSVRKHHTVKAHLRAQKPVNQLRR